VCDCVYVCVFACVCVCVCKREREREREKRRLRERRETKKQRGLDKGKGVWGRTGVVLSFGAGSAHSLFWECYSTKPHFYRICT